MRFIADESAVSPAEEWTSRVSVFLLADDAHQACVLRAREQGVNDVNRVCDCHHEPCDRECCR